MKHKEIKLIAANEIQKHNIKADMRTYFSHRGDGTPITKRTVGKGFACWYAT